jgi:hypothetical protein
MDSDELSEKKQQRVLGKKIITWGREFGEYWLCMKMKKNVQNNQYDTFSINVIY